MPFEDFLRKPSGAKSTLEFLSKFICLLYSGHCICVVLFLEKAMISHIVNTDGEISLGSRWSSFHNGLFMSFANFIKVPGILLQKTSLLQLRWLFIFAICQEALRWLSFVSKAMANDRVELPKASQKVSGRGNKPSLHCCFHLLLLVDY